MRLLVVLQNAWGVEDGYIPSFERRSFVRSHTGKRLKEMLPEGYEVFIRNASPKVGKVSGANYRPEPAQLEKYIKTISPDVILACGKNAQKALDSLKLDIPVIKTFHPAYRALSKKITSEIKEKLEETKHGINRATVQK